MLNEGDNDLISGCRHVERPFEDVHDQGAARGRMQGSHHQRRRTRWAQTLWHSMACNTGRPCLSIRKNTHVNRVTSALGTAAGERAPTLVGRRVGWEEPTRHQTSERTGARTIALEKGKEGGEAGLSVKRGGLGWEFTLSEVAVEGLVAEETCEARLVIFDVVWTLPRLSEVHGLLASPALITSAEPRSCSSCTIADTTTAPLRAQITLRACSIPGFLHGWAWVVCSCRPRLCFERGHLRAQRQTVSQRTIERRMRISLPGEGVASGDDCTDAPNPKPLGPNSLPDGQKDVS